MKCTTFGKYVTVTVIPGDFDRNKQPEVTVNWAALGSCNIADTQEFCNQLQEALGFARSETQRLNAPIRGLV